MSRRSEGSITYATDVGEIRLAKGDPKSSRAIRPDGEEVKIGESVRGVHAALEKVLECTLPDAVIGNVLRRVSLEWLISEQAWRTIAGRWGLQDDVATTNALVAIRDRLRAEVDAPRVIQLLESRVPLQPTLAGDPGQTQVGTTRPVVASEYRAAIGQLSEFGALTARPLLEALGYVREEYDKRPVRRHLRRNLGYSPKERRWKVESDAWNQRSAIWFKPEYRCVDGRIAEAARAQGIRAVSTNESSGIGSLPELTLTCRSFAVHPTLRTAFAGDLEFVSGSTALQPVRYPLQLYYHSDNSGLLRALPEHARNVMGELTSRGVRLEVIVPADASDAADFVTHDESYLTVALMQASSVGETFPLNLDDFIDEEKREIREHAFRDALGRSFNEVALVMADSLAVFHVESALTEAWSVAEATIRKAIGEAVKMGLAKESALHAERELLAITARIAAFKASSAVPAADRDAVVHDRP